MKRRAPMRRESGFTIPELVITVLVLSLLLTVGVPSFRNMVQNNQMTSQINEFVSALLLTRSEAVKRNLSVRLCAVDDLGADPLTCDGTNWETGWMIYVDADGTKGPAADADECQTTTDKDCIVALNDGIAGSNNTLRGTPSQVSDEITYLPTGAIDPDEPSTYSPPVTFTVCDDRGATHAKAVVVSNTGRPRTSKTQGDGSALTCP